MKTLHVLIANGCVSCIYDDALRPLIEALGLLPIRASRVEIIPGTCGDYYVDFSPLAEHLNRPELVCCLARRFARRDEALAAEEEFLTRFLTEDNNGEHSGRVGADSQERRGRDDCNPQR